ncbi:hypothetical protein PHMEG_00022780 [Phytophthora megakarya]|uniref:E2F/DP family winged-helix DNA-binding domain-containing protein n=1 Tax=Phytophthora megakarya TaxID=4795 RepID=A0A225VK78_9STRA|nr:hypothetical protein PHMEG_00022780 [Phytophthora megakarya]
MMHLLTGSQETKCPALKSSKTKRRYVRKAPKKVGPSAKRQIKTAWMEADMGKPPVKDAKTEDKGDWKMEGDEVRFFPFREYNRKDKSLGLLCENFLKLYRDSTMTDICLDQAAMELGVERRRIYDIVNILESIHLVSRKSKNLYNWHGLASLPTSISAMKVRRLLTWLCYPGDRRRGKSLSKLSQMFVQLFLEKEDCIIPLDQAAKQLIQMEDSENEEDRLLKTKIRRLYDVANVLVSVGLIEKLQLSNSRKPVFRWKTRYVASSEESAIMAEDSENKPAQPLSIKSEPVPPGAEEEDRNLFIIPSSSDTFDDGSDSQSDASSCGSKRKQTDQDASDMSMSDGESVTKRKRKISEDKISPRKIASLLRMDANNEPLHPQDVLCEQQEQLKLYMQQYIREYVEYLATHQKLPDAFTLTNSADAKGELVTPSSSKSSTTISKDMHGTPVNLPSLAGSIQDLLLSESPQSVADIVVARVLSISQPPISTSPVAVEPEAETSPRPLILGAGKKQAVSVAKSSMSSPTKPTTKDDERYDAPRNLIMTLQRRSQL